MIKHFIYFSMFLFLPFTSKNQPFPVFSCFETLQLTNISAVGVFCPVTLDIGLGYDESNCEWSTMFQFLNFGGCGPNLTIPNSVVNVFPISSQCSGNAQIVRLAGTVYYQWRVTLGSGSMKVVLGSGTFFKDMYNETVRC